MTLKLIGALMIIAGCSGVGYYVVYSHKREEDALRQLIAALDYMECELQYRLTPLPELCRSAAADNKGAVCTLMLNLAKELDRQISPDAAVCMQVAIEKTPKLPDKTKKLLSRLGGSLGRFDMSGQLRGLENTRILCRKELDNLQKDRETRFKSYKTLAICAGIALAILFL